MIFEVYRQKRWKLHTFTRVINNCSETSLVITFNFQAQRKNYGVIMILNNIIVRRFVFMERQYPNWDITCNRNKIHLKSIIILFLVFQPSLFREPKTLCKKTRLS